MSLERRSTAPRCIGIYRSGAGFRPVEDQIEAIEAATKMLELELLRVKDLSIGEVYRPEVLVTELAQNRIDCLIVWRLDCLAPLFEDFESVVAFIARLSTSHITFLSVEDRIDSDDPASVVLAHLLRAWTELKRNRRIENARNSAIKAQQSGNIRKTGRKKKRDDIRIRELRKAGLSIRKIASQVGVSTTAVQRAIKDDVAPTAQCRPQDDSPDP